MADPVLEFGGFVFLTVLAMLLVQFSVIARSLFKKGPQGGKTELPVTVIIPAYNEEARIKKTLSSVANSGYPEKLKEIIVVDDGSVDRTLKIVKKFPNVKIIRQSHEGKAAALNRGVAEAKNSIIITIDADTIMDRDTIRNIIKPFSDKAVGGVNAQLRIENRAGVLNIFQRVEYIYNCILNEAFSLVANSSAVSFGGAMAAYRKPVLQKIGGFSQYTETEDFDIAVKIHKAGYRVMFEKSAIGYTIAPETIRGFARQRMRWWKGSLQTIRKNPDVFNPKKNPGLSFIFFNFVFWTAYALLGLFLISYQILYWLPYNTGSLFDAGFYLFRWLSLLGPLYAIYMIPVWGVSFATIFGISSAIVCTLILAAAIKKFNYGSVWKKCLAAFFFFPYTIVLNIMMVIGAGKFFLDKGRGAFVK